MGQVRSPSASKVEGPFPARISDVLSWDAEIIFLLILSAPHSWCKSNSEKIKIFQLVYHFLQIFKGNLVE
jgi:hypothetical protein